MYFILRILVFKFISQPQKTGTKTESCQLAKIRLERISQSNGSISSPLGFVIDRLNSTASLYRIAPCLCTYQRPSRGVDPGDIRGKSAGFADFCRQFLALDGGHWTAFALPRRGTRGKTRGICNVAAILKMKDPDHGDWV